MHRNTEVMSTKQVRIAALAERFPQRAFTSLAHHIDAQWLRTAYLMTRRDGAPSGSYGQNGGRSRRRRHGASSG